MADASPSRLATRRIDDRSVGFLVAGASQVAARWMLQAIWQQSPAIGGRDVAGAYVVALYSHNARFARRFADTHGIVHAGDDLAMLLDRREIRCVYVGSHPRHHAETVKTALLAGKHVLCEPPLSDDLEESQELEQMAHHRGLLLALNYTWRATGAMRRLREQLHGDAIGEVLGVRIDNTHALPLDRRSWRVQRPFGGVLWDRLLHDVDLLTFLLLNHPAEIQSHNLQNLLGSEIEEDVLSMVQLRGGLPAILHDSFVLAHAPVSVTVFGSTGSLWASHCQPGEKESWLVLRRGEQQQPVELDAIDPYRAGVARFLGAMRLGEAPLATPLDDRRAVAAVLAAQRSLQQQQRISLAQIR
jgi:1,5-anhydro-D-fructose reductase (1,5-anhydro-D-mannitol-forming)